MKQNSVDHIIFSTNNGITWTGHEEIKFNLTNDWQIYTWQFTIPANGNVNLHLGVVPPGSSLSQTAGNILIKNIRLYRNSANVSVAAQLNCAENIICNRNITATGFASTSDESIKENIQNASIGDCVNLFDAVDIKIYNRKDIGGNRIGFIAQNIQENITP